MDAQIALTSESIRLKNITLTITRNEAARPSYSPSELMDSFSKPIQSQAGRPSSGVESWQFRALFELVSRFRAVLRSGNRDRVHVGPTLRRVRLAVLR